MKQRKKTLPQIKKEIDFAYIKNLREQEQRGATFYEYARLSKPVVEIVAQMNCEGVGRGKSASPGLLTRLQPIMSSATPWMPLLLMLVYCEGFPHKPYKNVQKNPGLTSLIDEANGLGMLMPCILPWHIIDSEKANKNNRWGDAGNVHAIFIPWRDFTNREIAEQLTQKLYSWRPANVPEPAPRGRKGRFASGIVDKLNELAAYRLDLGQFDKSSLKDSSGQPIYRTPEGWDKAIQTAKGRIDGMLKDPFFEV